VTAAGAVSTDGGVVDASVLVKLFLPEEGSVLATDLIRDLTARRALAVPDLAYSECANIFRTWVRRGLLSPDLARQSVADLMALPLRVWPDHQLVEPALDLALDLDLTVYDGIYVALAAGLSAPLYTADAALARKISPTTTRVRVLGASGWS
jgi:predicted nucleic acid-binding protein